MQNNIFSFIVLSQKGKKQTGWGYYTINYKKNHNHKTFTLKDQKQYNSLPVSVNKLYEITPIMLVQK